MKGLTDSERSVETSESKGLRDQQQDVKGVTERLASNQKHLCTKVPGSRADAGASIYNKLTQLFIDSEIKRSEPEAEGSRPLWREGAPACATETDRVKLLPCCCPVRVFP